MTKDSICSQCVGCANQGNSCGGQAGVFFPEACPSNDNYIGLGRWD